MNCQKQPHMESHVAGPDRLAALHAVALLDTPSEEAFDPIETFKELC